MILMDEMLVSLRNSPYVNSPRIFNPITVNTLKNRIPNISYQISNFAEAFTQQDLAKYLMHKLAI